MKKVCVVTWYGGTNYGTNLQAYALTKAISKLGYDVTIKGSIVGSVNYLTHPSYLGRRIKTRLCYEIKKRQKTHKGDLSYNDLQIKKFAQFCSDSFVKLNSHGKKEWDLVCKDYIAFVTGSDQVWNPFYFQDAMMLDFIYDNCIRKISYAPSIGITKLPNKVKRKYKKYLSSYSAISVREESAAKLLQPLCNSKVTVVMDPTMLLDRSDWDKCFNLSSDNDDSNYILCYFVGNRLEYWEYVKQMQISTGLSVYVIPMHRNVKEIKTSGFRIIDDAGPIEFVRLIRNSRFVCTDSFHATAISLIYNKEFYVLRRFTDGAEGSQNDRLYNILKEYSLDDRWISDEAQFVRLPEIDYNSINSKMSSNRIKSIDFLRSALNGEEII